MNDTSARGDSEGQG